MSTESIDYFSEKETRAVHRVQGREKLRVGANDLRRIMSTFGVPEATVPDKGFVKG